MKQILALTLFAAGCGAASPPQAIPPPCGAWVSGAVPVGFDQARFLVAEGIGPDQTQAHHQAMIALGAQVDSVFAGARSASDRVRARELPDATFHQEASLTIGPGALRQVSTEAACQEAGAWRVVLSIKRDEAQTLTAEAAEAKRESARAGQVAQDAELARVEADVADAEAARQWLRAALLAGRAEGLTPPATRSAWARRREAAAAHVGVVLDRIESQASWVGDEVRQALVELGPFRGDAGPPHLLDVTLHLDPRRMPAPPVVKYVWSVSVTAWRRDREGHTKDATAESPPNYDGRAFVHDADALAALASDERARRTVREVVRRTLEQLAGISRSE